MFALQKSCRVLWELRWLQRAHRSGDVVAGRRDGRNRRGSTGGTGGNRSAAALLGSSTCDDGCSRSGSSTCREVPTRDAMANCVRFEPSSSNVDLSSEELSMALRSSATAGGTGAAAHAAAHRTVTHTAEPRYN